MKVSSQFTACGDSCCFAASSISCSLWLFVGEDVDFLKDQLDGHIAINLSIIRSKYCEIRSADGLGYERKAVEEYQLLIQ